MKHLLLAAALLAPLFASANYLTNGSFEMTALAPGSLPGLAGWTSVPGSAVTPPGTVPYGVPGAFFGATVPLNTVASISPDAVGQRAFYFADDASPEAISSSLVLPAGTYIAGFDYYVPAYAAPAPADATLWVLAGPSIQLWQTNLSTLTTGSWQSFSTTFTLTAPLNSVSIFDTTPYGSASLPTIDLLIDRAFVVAVPEANTTALMLAGLCAMGWRMSSSTRASSGRQRSAEPAALRFRWQ